MHTPQDIEPQIAASMEWQTDSSVNGSDAVSTTKAAFPAESALSQGNTPANVKVNIADAEVTSNTASFSNAVPEAAHTAKRASSEAIRQMVEAFITETTPEVFVVEITHRTTPRHILRVEVDTDSGIALTTCTELNRGLRAMLEARTDVRQDFELEVGSPGVGAPMKLKRQYQKNIGRKVSVLLTNGIRIDGLLTQVNESSICINTDIQEGKTGRKKRLTTDLDAEKTIPLQDIKETRVQISFS